eukprot:3218476-Amphidinium_carterae.1
MEFRFLHPEATMLTQSDTNRSHQSTITHRPTPLSLPSTHCQRIDGDKRALQINLLNPGHVWSVTCRIDQGCRTCFQGSDGCSASCMRTCRPVRDMSKDSM